MSDVHFQLRLARPEELHEIIRIDDAASGLYAEAGIEFALAKSHPFVLAEAERWARAIERGLAHVAVDLEDALLGFMTLGFVDGAPYLDQLSVHPRAMRRGIGDALLKQAFEWSRPRPLWLTTYSHVPWNLPYYERRGFVVVPEETCGPEMKAVLDNQRKALPDPDKRVAMVRIERQRDG